MTDFFVEGNYYSKESKKFLRKEIRMTQTHDRSRRSQFSKSEHRDQFENFFAEGSRAVQNASGFIRNEVLPRKGKRLCSTDSPGVS